VEKLGTKIVVAAGLGIVALGLLYIASRGSGSVYVDYLPGVLLLGTGLALTWAPTTESIMGSVPAAKAGVGSAVNDTVREVGGALGVAVLGSVLASHYAAAFAPTSAALPTDAA